MRHAYYLLTAFLLILLACRALLAQVDSAFKVGATPPPQEVYTKVNLTEPYDIIEGFTIYPSLGSPDLFYYMPKPRVARTTEGRIVFRLLNYGMTENARQVGSADAAGGYVQFDVTMSPTPAEIDKIKQSLLNPPKRFKTISAKLAPIATKIIAARPAQSVHPYNQSFGAAAKPKLASVRLAPIPIHKLKAKMRLPGVLQGDKTETDWFSANGDASGTTTFAINLSGPQALALYQAITEPAAVEPFSVYFDGEVGGYIKCKARMSVNTREVFNYMQQQEGSSKKSEKPGTRGISLFGIVNIGGSQAQTRQEDKQYNDIDVSHVLGTSIKIEGDLQGYDDVLLALGKYAMDQAFARFGNPIPLDELIDPKRELKDPQLPPNAPKPSAWGYLGLGYASHGLIQPGKDQGRTAYYGFLDEKSMNRANAASFSVDLDKQIAVTWQFAPSTSIFDDALVEEIRKNKQMYAQKMALNDPFFEKLDVTYTANLDFIGGPFSKVVFSDTFRLKDGSYYNVPGLLLESRDTRNEQGQLLGAAPPANLRFTGLLQGNLYQGEFGGGTFNILNAASRTRAQQTGKWPTFADGSPVKGITHRWKYQIYFRPSVTDNDFPASWTSPEFTNSESVLTATIPPVITAVTVSPFALGSRVAQAMVQIRCHAQLKHRNLEDAVTIKSVGIRPGGPERRVYFYDDNPATTQECEYNYTVYYNDGKPPHVSGWLPSVGGVIVPYDPTAYATPQPAPEGTPTVIEDF